MTERMLIRGDDYLARRPVFRFSLIDLEATVDPNAPVPLDLSGKTVRATFRPTPVDPTVDPTDATAKIAAEIIFGTDGSVSGTPQYLFMPSGAVAADGTLEMRLPRSVTSALPLGESLGFDIQVTNEDGENDTVVMVETLNTRDAYTSRGTA